MLDILRKFLSEATTQEHMDAIAESIQLFDKFGINTYEFDYEQILMSDEHSDSDAGDSMSYIDKLTRDILIGILRERTIVLQDDVSLATLNLFVGAMWDLENAEEADAIVSTCDMEGTIIEKFAALVSLVTPKNTIELMVEVEEVGESLINAIREMYRGDMEQQQSEEERALNEASIKELKLFILFLGDHRLKIVDMITKGVPVAMPFKNYMDVVGRDFENMEPSVAAREMVAFALTSSDCYESPKVAISNVVENYIASLKTITAITIEVSDLVVRFETFKTTRSNQEVVDIINKGIQ